VVEMRAREEADYEAMRSIARSEYWHGDTLAKKDLDSFFT